MCHSQGEQVKPPSTRVVVTNRGDEPGEPGGQTGSFPSPKISNHYEPNESCQTNIRKRCVCPRFRRTSSSSPATTSGEVEGTGVIGPGKPSARHPKREGIAARYHAA